MDSKWTAVAKPPSDMLKKISGGRLAGMTDIKPQWRYQIMTETYGMCGEGWKYEIERLWTEPASENQVFAFAQVNVYTRGSAKGEWSSPIPGTGGSMLVTKEKSGLHSSDEGFKMAVTDAIGTSLKMIGVASEVYMGHADSKYNPPQASGSAPAEKPWNDEGQAKGQATGVPKMTFEKEGKGARGAWHLWKFTVGNEEDLGTFDEDTAESLIAAEDEGKGMLVDWSTNAKGNKAIDGYVDSTEALPF